MGTVIKPMTFSETVTPISVHRPMAIAELMSLFSEVYKVIEK